MTGFNHHEVIRDSLWSPDRFPDAISEFTAGMLDLQRDGIVEGAFIHGRAATHLDGGQPDTDERSDLDVVIIPASKSPEDLIAIRRVATEIYASHLIELEPWCFTREQLGEGDHNLDGSFKAWMEAAIASQSEYDRLTAPIRGLYIKPLDEVKDTYRGEHDLDRYFGQRFDIEQTYLRGVFHDPAGELDHVLRFPFETGREVIGHLRYLGILPSEFTSLGLEREGVAQTMQGLLARMDSRLAELYDEIQQGSVAYTGLMQEAHHGKISEAEYEQIVRETLTYAIPKTLEVTGRFRRAYKEYCEMQAATAGIGRMLIASRP